MLNKFVNTDSNKRYYTFDYYLKNKYHSKVFKVSLDASFTCPNRDGTVSKGGCIYCSKLGSGEYAQNKKKDLIQQFYDGKKEMEKKWKNGKAIAYFQAFTNTYAPLSYLHSVYDQFLTLDDCIAISIATRPDCLSKETLDYLEYINSRKDLYVELGLQTINDETAELINRGYKYEVFANAVKELNQRNIKVVVHIINGLPNESKEDMINTIKRISLLPIFGIKFHCLNILKDTKLADIYQDINLHILSKEEYLDIVSEQLTYLPNNIVVERINTDAKRSELITPTWNEKKVSVSNDLDKLLEAKDIYQGMNAYKYKDYIKLAHNLLLTSKNKDVAVDATLGNGYDSLFLVNHYKDVYSFDIQELALRRSNEKLKYYDNIHLYNDSYANIDKYVKGIDALIYNLGFLPGSNHNIKTNGKDTIKSLSSALPLLNKGGKCIIVSYLIHDNKEEYNLIKEYLENINKSEYIIVSTSFDNIIIFEIEKL